MKASRNKQLDYLLVNMISPPHIPSTYQAIKHRELHSNLKVKFTLKGVKQYYAFGPGVALYFGLLRFLIASFLILIFASIPMMISNSNGNGLSMYNQKGNIGIMRYSLANQQFFEYPQQTTDEWSQEDVKRLEGIESTQLFLIFNDVIITFLFAGLLILWGVKSNKIVKQITGVCGSSNNHLDEINMMNNQGAALPSYYTLKITNLQRMAKIIAAQIKEKSQLFEAKKASKMQKQINQQEPNKDFNEEQITKNQIYKLMQTILTSPTNINQMQRESQKQMALNSIHNCKIELVYDYKDFLYELNKFLELISQYGQSTSEDQKHKLYNEIEKQYYDIKKMYIVSTQLNLTKFNQPFLPVKGFISFTSIKEKQQFFKMYKKWKIQESNNGTGVGYLSQKIEELDIELMDLTDEQTRIYRCEVEPSNIIWQNYHLNDLMNLSKKVKMYCLLFLILLVALISIFLINLSMSSHIANHFSFNQYKNTVQYQQNPDPTYKQAVQSQEAIVIYIFCSQLTGKTFQWEYYQLCEDYFTNFQQRVFSMILLSSLVFSINFILNKVIHFLAQRRRYRTFSDKQRFLIVTIFAVVLINSGLLILIIRAQLASIEDSPNKSDVESISMLELFRSIFGQGFFENKQVQLYEQFNRKWFVHIGKQLMFNFLISLIIAPWFILAVRVLQTKFREYRSRSSITQKQMNQKMMFKKFDFQSMYALEIVAIWFTLCYGSGIPVFYIMCLLSLIGLFISSKIIFKFYSRKPLLFDHLLNIKICRILMVGLVVHQVFSIWFLFSKDIFADREQIYSNTKDYHKIQRVFIFVIVMILLILASFYYEQIVKFFVAKRQSCKKDRSDDSSHQDVIVTGIGKDQLIQQKQLDQRMSQDGMSSQNNQKQEKLPYHKNGDGYGLNPYKTEKVEYIRSYKMQDNPQYDNISYTLMILNMTINEHQSIQAISQHDLVFEKHHQKSFNENEKSKNDGFFKSPENEEKNSNTLSDNQIVSKEQNIRIKKEHQLEQINKNSPQKDDFFNQQKVKPQCQNHQKSLIDHDDQQSDNRGQQKIENNQKFDKKSYQDEESQF